MMIITKPCLKSRSMFTGVISVGKNKFDKTATPFEACI